MMKIATQINKSAKKKLKEVVNINKDALELYKNAQQQVECANLRRTFNRLEDTHHSVMGRIDVLMQKSNTSYPGEQASETVIGKSNRIIGQLIVNLSSNPDQSLVSLLNKAESRCLHSLQEATELTEINENTRQVLEQELEKTRQTHDFMRHLKQRIAA